jgi:hypothetical protein
MVDGEFQANLGNIVKHCLKKKKKKESNKYKFKNKANSSSKGESG